jgi:hypothetical protein
LCGGKVAKQQTAGPLQLPLNNCGVMAFGLRKEEVATSIGHSPVAALLILLQEQNCYCRAIKCLGTYQKRWTDFTFS